MICCSKSLCLLLGSLVATRSVLVVSSSKALFLSSFDSILLSWSRRLRVALLLWSLRARVSHVNEHSRYDVSDEFLVISQCGSELLLEQCSLITLTSLVNLLLKIVLDLALNLSNAKDSVVLGLSLPSNDTLKMIAVVFSDTSNRSSFVRMWGYLREVCLWNGPNVWPERHVSESCWELSRVEEDLIRSRCPASLVAVKVRLTLVQWR